MKKLLITAVLLLITIYTFAQTGQIKGSVKDAVSQEGIIGANVLIEGLGTGASTDIEGNFTIKNIPAGTYSVVVSYVGYVSKKVEGVKIEANKALTLEIQIEETKEELETVTVVAAKETMVAVAVVSEVRFSNQIAVGISAEQISKSQDRDASEVVRRLPGVTIMDNRFIMVRGLSERYNAVMLNNALTPSSEADRKSFSFDIIPSGMIDRLLIYKSGAPELPGEFAGGVVKIYTKNIPDENSSTLNISTSYRSGTTFEDFYSSKGSSTDFLGFDDGFRALPSNFPRSLYNVTSQERLTELGQALPNNWTSTKSTAMPDFRLNFFNSRSFRVAGLKVGTINSISYSRTQQHFVAQRTDYNQYDQIAQKNDTIFNYFDAQYDENVRVGLMSNWSVLINPYHKIEFKNLFNQMGTNQTTLRKGYSLEEGFDVRNSALRYESRMIFSSQLLGEHEISPRLSLNWTLGYSYSGRNEPDFRRFRTVKNLGSGADVPYQLIIPPSANTLDAGRFYSILHEDILVGKADVEYKIGEAKDKDGKKVPTLRAGFYIEDKYRTFNARWMSYKAANESQFDRNIPFLPFDQLFSAKNINNTTGLKLEEGTSPSDRYIASNFLAAGYVGTSLYFGKFTLSGGVRLENNLQSIKTKEYSGAKIAKTNDILSILPSVNVAYDINQKSLVRLAYSKTINRPEFRELARFPYYDFIMNNNMFGNENLKIADIHNIDFRYEFYPSAAETIAIGAFYKYFTNPIETVFIPGGGSGGTRNFGFDNANWAKSVGLEIEVRKNLDFLGASRFFENLSLVGNAAWIYSEVDLNNKVAGQKANRPMMGQSPYVINTGLYYNDEDRRIQISALYNVFGARIFAVGTADTPDIYEMPRNIIDLTFTKGFGNNWEFKAGIQDILNQPIWLLQDSNDDGKLEKTQDPLFRQFRRGSYTTVGISYKF